MYQIDFQHPIHIHFIGIGGISMCCLAELLADAGFRVSGSDRAPSPLTHVLESKGIKVFYGQRAENMTDPIDCVVFTSAILPDNPEYIAAHEKQLPCLTRGQLMGQIMKNYQMPVAVSGTHGKTTTTSMISEILLQADLDPTLSIGGILKDIGSNMRIGKSGYFVTEACEYTNSFLDFFPRIGIILNIEADHLDFFRDLDDIRNSFRKFAELLPENGCLIINGQIENPDEITHNLKCPVVTFGPDDNSDYHPADIHYNSLGCPTFTLYGPGNRERQFTLQVPGEHNIYNAMAAVALADRLSIDSGITVRALGAYRGTGRRRHRHRRLCPSSHGDYRHFKSRRQLSPQKTLVRFPAPHLFTDQGFFKGTGTGPYPGGQSGPDGYLCRPGK